MIKQSTYLLFLLLLLYGSCFCAKKIDSDKNTILRKASKDKRKNNHIVRGPSYPYISGDTFRSLAKHILDEESDICNPHIIQHGDIVFVKTDFLDYFFQQKHPYIATKYILITHNSDIGAPGIFASFLNDEKIIAWFGQNGTIAHHPKFIPIPIGVANKYISHGNEGHFNNALKILKTKNTPREYLIGVNFKPDTLTRKPLYNYFKTKQCYFFLGTHEEYLENMTNLIFVISPPGNGYDCHRTWEALLMGAIPIVQSSTADQMFEDLPVLIIKKEEWKEISEEYLENVYQEMIKKTYNYEKVYFDYWKKLIYS